MLFSTGCKLDGHLAPQHSNEVIVVRHGVLGTAAKPDLAFMYHAAEVGPRYVRVAWNPANLEDTNPPSVL